MPRIERPHETARLNHEEIQKVLIDHVEQTLGREIDPSPGKKKEVHLSSKDGGTGYYKTVWEGFAHLSPLPELIPGNLVPYPPQPKRLFTASEVSDLQSRMLGIILEIRCNHQTIKGFEEALVEASKKGWRAE